MEKYPSVSRIFWDWDGVLGKQRFWHIAMESDNALRSFADRLFADKFTVETWMRGDISLADLCTTMGDKYSANELGRILQQDWSQEGAVNTLLFSQIAQQYPTAQHYISTDNMDVFHSFADVDQFITDNFVKVYNSADARALKGDTPGLYEHILDDLSLSDFNDCLVLDDNIAPCERFRSLGGRALLVKNFAVKDVDDSLVGMT